MLEDTVAESVRDEPAGEVSSETEVGPRRRALPLWAVAIAIALLLVIGEIVAVSLANNGSPGAATILGQILVVATAFPLALGLFVALRGPRRAWGIGAMVLSLIANPLILLNVLSFFGGL